MRIGEAARETGVTIKAIRHYEAVGLLTTLERDGRHRQLSTEHLQQLRLIAHWRGLGFILREIREVLHGERAAVRRRSSRIGGQSVAAHALRPRTCISAHHASFRTTRCRWREGACVMEESGRPVERRSAARVAVTGSVVVRLDGAIPGRLLDLSIDAVRFAPSPGVGPYAPGTSIVLDIRLDGATSGWFRFVAVILRSTATETVAAFSLVPHGFAEAVHSELRAAAASVDTPGVLLVDTHTPRRILVAAALRAAGCDVTEVSTPLEAISHLNDSQARPWLIAIGDTVPATVADELRAHMQSAHALVRLVAISDTSESPAAERLTTAESSDLSDQVARLVASRWN